MAFFVERIPHFFMPGSPGSRKIYKPRRKSTDKRPFTAAAGGIRFETHHTNPVSFRLHTLRISEKAEYMKPIVCLLIDDDQDERDIFNFAVEDLTSPVRCLRAASGSEAIDKLKNGQFIPDIIFLDMYMPRMDGAECLSRLRRLAIVRKVPIIVYSTGLSESHREQMRLLGADGFLEKTSNIPDLTRELGVLMSENPVFTQFAKA
jgi:CheY-like chemotaxis protein